MFFNKMFFPGGFALVHSSHSGTVTIVKIMPHAFDLHSIDLISSGK